MDPSIILAGISLGLNLFQGASDSANADDIIQAQHDSAVMNTEFQNTERESQFNQQKATIDLNKANNENELRFRESNDLANYNFQVAQNTADYDARKEAYRLSGLDNATQKSINADLEALALNQTQQKYNDQQTALGFQNQEQLLNQLGQYNSMVTRLDQSQTAIDDALMRETLMETEALRVRNQSYDSANYGLEMIREQAGEAQTTADLQNAQIQERVNTSRTGRDEQLMLLDQGKATDNLNTDNNIYRNQLQTNQQVALENLRLQQTTGSLKGDLGDQELATSQLIERLGIKNEGDNLSIEQKKALIEDEFSGTKLQTEQKIAQLTDEQQYNLLSRDSGINDLGFELEQTRLQYEQNRAAQSFKQEANRIDQLLKSGQINAQGRKGASAARSINNVLSAAGRQSAQLTDAILRGKKNFDSKVTDITRKTGDVNKRFGLQTDTTNRKKLEQRALLGRAEVAKDLRITQSGQEKDQLTKMFTTETSQAQGKLAQEETNTQRKIDQASEMSGLTIGQTKQSSTQAIGDLTEGRALRNDQAYQQAVYVNDKFTNAFNSLSAEQNLLAENLQQQLNSYSRETGKLNQQKDFATQNYNVAYQAAQEVHDSAMRKYNDTAADVERERARLGKQDQMIEDQYQASLQSAQQAKLASEGQITLDRYSADVTADKALMPEPVLAPNPPQPISYPRTLYPELTDDHKPQLLPEPIKGEHSGVQFAGAIASFASDLAGVDWG
tara:strand:- start:593 stop:2788 length:2196 start_codon:yes stop_codon:yes gene_type:complete